MTTPTTYRNTATRRAATTYAHNWNGYTFTLVKLFAIDGIGAFQDRGTHKFDQGDHAKLGAEYAQRWTAGNPNISTAALSPESNTEQAQQNAAELEQAEPMTYTVWNYFDEAYLSRNGKVIAIVGRSERWATFHSDKSGRRDFRHITHASYNRLHDLMIELQHASQFHTPTQPAPFTVNTPAGPQLTLPGDLAPTCQPAQLFDPIATLPLFSGTAPRGQAQTFDPPAADGHRQAKLF